jgi:hypothetical protein
MDRTAAFTFDDAEAQMARCRLGHKRRTDRLVDSARRISRHPGGTLPEKLRDPAAYRATLRLMNHPDVTHEAILRPHIEETLQRLRRTPTTVLILHDIVELDYSKQMTLGGLGQIGNGGGRGYECHNSLAVDPESGELIGLVGQQLHNRACRPAREGVAAGRARLSRESLLWVNAARRIGPAPAGCHWVDVCDRGADTFEFLEDECRAGRHFVVRSTHSRALEVQSEGSPRRLHESLRALPARSGWTVEVSANKGQPARTARVLCSWAEVTLRAPHVRRGRHSRESLTAWALRVWEVDAPEWVKEPLEWLLLTDEAIADSEAARRRVGYYERRPRVEDYHKAQKTGLGIERLQLQSQAGLQPLIALLSVLAVALVNAREAARDEAKANRPATDYFDRSRVRVLSVWRYGEERPLTVREYILALGRLGGHLNRKCDGLPGWLTLWRGTMLLDAMVAYEQRRRSAEATAEELPPPSPRPSRPSIGKL